MIYDLIDRCRWLRTPFVFLGEHSMNMFLCHTFFLMWVPWLYKGNPILTFPVLLALSSFSSFLLELVKKLIRFDHLLAKLK